MNFRNRVGQISAEGYCDNDKTVVYGSDWIGFQYKKNGKIERFKGLSRYSKQLMIDMIPSLHHMSQDNRMTGTRIGRISNSKQVLVFGGSLILGQTMLKIRDE
ncbi:hypothetical protein RF11_15945 [Thelohanellus kitauei]|uniref:Uncharacterized protein n=1 Tax=Thelohanellus kitauei TaxID=669202 RepID=A0A0C2MH50_THEKT|nr:hypothetical protein RF11_15945 [Thelohanellus kitauei]